MPRSLSNAGTAKRPPVLHAMKKNFVVTITDLWPSLIKPMKIQHLNFTWQGIKAFELDFICFAHALTQTVLLSY